MATVPQTFPSIPPTPTVNYDYSQISDGTGIQTVYGAFTGSLTGTGDGSLLSTTMASNTKEGTITIVWPAAGELVYSGATTLYSLGAFNLPKNVKGTAYVEAYFKGKKAAAPDGNLGEVNIKAHLYKNSTEIASGSNGFAAVNGTTYNTSASGSLLIPITISDVVHYARGDVLKIGLEFAGNPDGGSGGTNNSQITFVWGTDPLDRDGTNIKPSIEADATTVLKVHVPFRPDDLN